MTTCKLKNKIRVGVVGCGRISQNHFKAIQHHSDSMQIKAVCDGHPECLKTAQEKYQVPGFSTLKAMLETADIDMVVLCTPSGLHAQQACLAAEYGKHVVTEKPMATRWQDGVQMVKACDKADVQLFVVKQSRRHSTIRGLKDAIEQGRFGKIYLVQCNVFWTRPQEYYTGSRWRGTWEFDGGAFMNQASHFVDLLEWLIGPVASVQALTGTLARDIEVEDTGVLNIRYRSGALGSMNVTMLTYPKNYEGSITIIGEKGTVRVGGTSANKIEHWEFADGKDSLEDVQKLNFDPKEAYGQGHIAYYSNVAKSLRGEELPETDGREGLRSLELLIATYLSARDEETVYLPLEY